MSDALRRIGIENLANVPVGQMSGGQRQRVAIARAIVNNPDVLLADEPTGNLDDETAKDIFDVFVRLNSHGKTVVMVTHDLTLAKRCRRIVELDCGKIAKDILL